MYVIEIRELSIIHYLMAASAGIEVGSFNLAYLCESLVDDVATLRSSLPARFRSECVWTYYNRSVHADLNSAHGYALNKMADFHYYESSHSGGIVRNHHLDKAIEFYALAYRRGEAQVNK